VPELPDIAAYIDALESRILGKRLEGIRLGNPFILRTVSPAAAELAGKKVTGFQRIGKVIVLEMEDDLFIAIHLMIAGRFRWKDEPGTKLPGKMGLAAFDFENGTLTLTEASTKKRAALHLIRGAENLDHFRRGGVEPLSASLAEFQEALQRENHTLKRSLTDPRLFSGIGNAYSDEILHRAKLSPVKLTSRMTVEEIERLYHATQAVLIEWTDQIREEAGDGFPTHVTAFREGMAAHGRFGKPCPTCGSPIQRIVYAENEANYCAACQTDGKLLADRSLSRLMKGDWPRTINELEERRQRHSTPLDPDKGLQK
jgi:formamidopyrimidine-DNA glycosylase